MPVHILELTLERQQLRCPKALVICSAFIDRGCKLRMRLK